MIKTKPEKSVNQKNQLSLNFYLFKYTVKKQRQYRDIVIALVRVFHGTVKARRFKLSALHTRNSYTRAIWETRSKHYTRHQPRLLVGIDFSNVGSKTFFPVFQHGQRGKARKGNGTAPERNFSQSAHKIPSSKRHNAFRSRLAAHHPARSSEKVASFANDIVDAGLPCKLWLTRAWEWARRRRSSEFYTFRTFKIRFFADSLADSRETRERERERGRDRRKDLSRWIASGYKLLQTWEIEGTLCLFLFLWKRLASTRQDFVRYFNIIREELLRILRIRRRCFF